MPAPLSEETQAWRERNPLRAWRKRQLLTMADVAGTTGLAFASVQLWESGGREPSDDAYARLAAYMDRNEARLRRAWKRWLDTRPSVAA